MNKLSVRGSQIPLTIEFNGEEIADSQFIINFISKTYNCDMNSSLSENDKAIGRAFVKMLEENTYWYVTVNFAIVFLLRITVLNILLDFQNIFKGKN